MKAARRVDTGGAGCSGRLSVAAGGHRPRRAVAEGYQLRRAAEAKISFADINFRLTIHS